MKNENKNQSSLSPCLLSLPDLIKLEFLFFVNKENKKWPDNPNGASHFLNNLLVSSLPKRREKATPRKKEREKNKRLENRSLQRPSFPCLYTLTKIGAPKQMSPVAILLVVSRRRKRPTSSFQVPISSFPRGQTRFLHVNFPCPLGPWVLLALG